MRRPLLRKISFIIIPIAFLANGVFFLTQSSEKQTIDPLTSDQIIIQTPSLDSLNSDSTTINSDEYNYSN